MELERIVGKLEGKVEGIQETQKHHDVRFDRIEGKLDTLLEFKWKVAGGVIIVAFLADLAINIAKASR